MTIESLLPPRIIKMLRESGIKVKVGPTISGHAAQYEVATSTVTFNPDPHPDLQKLAAHYTAKFNLEIEPEAVYVLLSFHEAYHHEHREHLKKISLIEAGSIGKTLSAVQDFRNRAKNDAWEECLKRFFSWKTNSWDIGDFEKWKQAKKF